MYPNVNLFIDGAWRPAASGKTLSVLNPATGEPIGTRGACREGRSRSRARGRAEGLRDLAQGVAPTSATA